MPLRLLMSQLNHRCAEVTWIPTVEDLHPVFEGEIGAEEEAVDGCESGPVVGGGAGDVDNLELVAEDTEIDAEAGVVTSEEARVGMVDVAETSAAIHLIATLPQRSNVPELTIRPTFQRDMSKEIVGMP